MANFASSHARCVANNSTEPLNNTSFVRVEGAGLPMQPDFQSDREVECAGFLSGCRGCAFGGFWRAAGRAFIAQGPRRLSRGKRRHTIVYSKKK
ncbi:hypothetical protein DQ04_00791000, partial [Trypanosoma grayi]|uniref:hypothetical protein n=1 Tax=Trypanosoma grayi TaxID=71804 RepID=UPI0004F3F06B